MAEMADVVRVMVTGSREWGNRRLWTRELSKAVYGLETVEVQSAVETLCSEHDARMRDALAWAWKHATSQYPGAQIVLLHGGADGADRAAASIWGGRSLPVQVEPALWDKEGKGAGFKRNLRMVEMGPVVVLAFQFDRSPGTEHAATAAVRAGVPVWLWAQRGFEHLHSLRVHGDNVRSVFPPLGKAGVARFQQAVPDAPSDEEGAPVTARATVPAATEQPSAPRCRVCAFEAAVGHHDSCPMRDFAWAKSPVFHDRALGADRCGSCGRSAVDHAPVACYVQVRPAQRKAAVRV